MKSSGFITLDNWDPQAFRVLMEFRETLGGFCQKDVADMGEFREIFDPPKVGVFPGTFSVAPVLDRLLFSFLPFLCFLCNIISQLDISCSRGFVFEKLLKTKVSGTSPITKHAEPPRLTFQRSLPAILIFRNAAKHQRISGIF